MIKIFSGEFFLKSRPNGGSVVFLRSSWVTVGIYLLAVMTKASIAPNHLWKFDLNELRLLISETIPWAGAIFAGSYAAFYTRFASQWAYLADVYNQIMATAIETSHDDLVRNKNLHAWNAAFIEDAEELHLACKPMFASVIRQLLSVDEVRRNFVESTPGGEARLGMLQHKIEKACASAEIKYGRKS